MLGLTLRVNSKRPNHKLLSSMQFSKNSAVSILKLHKLVNTNF